MYESQDRALSGQGFRIIPLFPWLRPYLDGSVRRGSKGAEYIFGRFREVGHWPQGLAASEPTQN